MENTIATELMLFAIIITLLGANIALVAMVTGKTLYNPFQKIVEAKKEVEKVKESAEEAEEVIDDLALSERDLMFQQRIEQMKSDLAMSQQFEPRVGYTAQEAHEGVTNLPHSIINDTHSDSTGGEEYAK